MKTASKEIKAAQAINAITVTTAARRPAGGPGAQQTVTKMAMKCANIKIPHQPPAKTFVVQKLAATFPNSVNIKMIVAKTSMMPINIRKHFGQAARKASLFGSAIC